MKSSDDNLGLLVASLVKQKEICSEFSNIEISRYIDKKTTEEENVLIEDHFKTCPTCKQHYLDIMQISEQLQQSAQTEQELKPEPLISRIRERFSEMIKARPLALAIPVAAAVLIIGLFNITEFSGLFKGDQGPMGFQEMISVLAEQDERLPHLKTIIDEPSGQRMTQAFAEGTTLEIAAFRLGVFFTEVELLLRFQKQSDQPEDFNQNDHLESISRQLSVFTQQLSRYDQDLPAQVETSQSIVEKEHLIRQRLKDHNVDFFMHFGEWSAGSQVAVYQSNKEFFDISTIRYFRDAAIQKKLPNGVISSLDGILEVASSGIDSEADYKIVLNNLNQIMELMLQFG